jgi:hypothetical protein
MFSPNLTKEFKRFMLELFATFLGLLMALGLEQWREARRDHRIAEEFLSRIQRELLQNRKEAADKLVHFQRSVDNDERLIKDLEAVLAARERHQPEPAVKIPLELRGDFFFQTSAWEAAKASGVLRYLGGDRIQGLSEIYTYLQALMAIQGQTYSTPEVSALITYTDEDPARMDAASLRRLLESVRFLRGTNRNMIQTAKQLLPELEAQARL